MKIEAGLIDRARDADLAALVGQHVKLVRRGRAWWGCCPFHAEKSPSFKVENQRFKCFGCDAGGDTIEWVRLTANIPFRDAVEALTGDQVRRASFTVQHAADYERQDDQRRIADAKGLWDRAQPIAGTHAEKYLRARGIADPCNPSLRFIEQFEYARGIMLPVMVAAMLSPERQVTAIQATYLNPQKPAKASVATPRRSLGPMGTGAVRLAAAGHKLGLAEGVETALSAMLLTGIPTWACLGAARMHRVAIPDGVRELCIFTDNDDAGLEAFNRTHRAHGNLLVLGRPSPAGKDWNDAIRAEARAA
jgi:DNA primase